MEVQRTAAGRGISNERAAINGRRLDCSIGCAEDRAAQGACAAAVGRERRTAHSDGKGLGAIDHHRSAIAAIAGLAAADGAGAVDAIGPVSRGLVRRKLAVVDTEVAPKGANGAAIGSTVGLESAADDRGAERPQAIDRPAAYIGSQRGALIIFEGRIPDAQYPVANIDRRAAAVVLRTLRTGGRRYRNRCATGRSILQGKVLNGDYRLRGLESRRR